MLSFPVFYDSPTVKERHILGYALSLVYVMGYPNDGQLPFAAKA